MSLLYKRLGSQGEIHLSNNDDTTLCGIRTTHPNWTNGEVRTGKDPLVCIECLDKLPKEEEKQEKVAKPDKATTKPTKSTTNKTEE